MALASPTEALLAVFFAFSGLALTALTVYFQSSHIPSRGSKSFTALLTLMVVWSFSAVAKLVGPVLVERVLVMLELPMGVAFALLFLIFASQYSGHNWHRRRLFSAYVVASSLGLAIGLLTNPIHHLFWSRIQLSTDIFPHLVHSELGPLYYLYIALAYLNFGLGVYGLVNLHLRSRYNTTSVVILIFGGSIPLLINIISVLDRAPVPGLDYTPIGLLIFGAATIRSMQMDLFDIVPLARDTAVEQSSEGMIILDSNRVIRDYNPTAVKLIPSLSTHRGDPLDHVLSDATGLFDTTMSTTVEITRGEEVTYLSIQSSRITDGPHHLGWTVVLSDITEQQRRERHLQLVSRVLRHNMANRINTIMGHVELLEVDADETEREHLRAIDSSAESIIETSVKLRTIQEITTTNQSKHETDISGIVDVVVEKYAGRYPDSTVTVDCPDDVFARCPPGFQPALENLVENGIEHNEDPSPTVSVTVTVDGPVVNLAVSDNGPGIPDTERRILEEGETPLRHSSGVGLWLVYCFVEQSGHELTFERSQSGGSEVRFSLNCAPTPN